MIRLVLVLLVVLLPTKVVAGNILILGDSLSAGYGIALADSWPELLKARLSQMGYPQQVINASISGETAAGGRNRLEGLLATWQPGILIIELGANDGLRGSPIATIHDNLDNIIRRTLATGARVVVAGMLLPPNYGALYTRQFQDVYTDLAGRYDLRFLPFILEGVYDKPELMLNDGLHPSALAQPLILDNIWRVLQPLLGQDAA
jgi:acyl-CoA thioesterase-1